ncbi:hypothetical protein [Altererythrobacter lutimaris]|uniref:Uncharacterized protein n=1 Tax=Altererythrobacter lutimaris TaxID=2743979 RepID=A0A850H2N5_9SPHN|nr:hypothetical protein [Altererythrobacter lutimaris]NVE93407.1 hypothetical protein [Altererythrobacter lutimaris]
MDSELVLIFTFVTTVLVILGFTANRIVSKALDHKKWMEENRASKRGSVSSDRQDALEERVRVLERIVTDKDVNLAGQIEALRDMQDIEQLTTGREKTS